jgi:hypothetical protein
MKALPLALTILLLTPVAGRGADSLGERIVKFCLEHKSKQVGNGECTSLAVEALKAAGAAPRDVYRDSPHKGDYVWGRLVAYREATAKGFKESGKISRIKPGDIMQLRDTKLKGTLDGKPYSWYVPQHHTAVIIKVEDDGEKITVLQQNMGDRKVVTEAQFQLQELTGGWIRIYRPLPKRAQSR